MPEWFASNYLAEIRSRVAARMGDDMVGCRYWREVSLITASMMLLTTTFDASQIRPRAPAVEVGADAVVPVSIPMRPLVEPHLAADPRNPQHLVGAATVSVQDEANLSLMRCVAVATFDGARTWVVHEFDFQGCEDPWVEVLDDGSAIFVGMENRNRGIVHPWLYRSPDGGRTWTTPPHSFGPNHDHPTLVVDRSFGRFRGALYVVSMHAVRDENGRWQSKTFIARSMDGGATFAEVIEHDLLSLNYGPMKAAVLSDGSLLVPLLARHRYDADARSIVPLKNVLLFAVRSEDGGAHVGRLTLVTDTCNALRNGGFPSLAADPSRARVFAACLDGGRAGPFVMRSDDGGDRWSDPVHVPKTAPTAPTGQRRVPNIAVNRDGILAVTWVDRGSDPASRCWDVFVAISADGDAFSDAHNVSTKPSCPATPGNGWAAERHPFGGGYSGLVAAADGTFHLLWADSREDHYQLRTALVRVTR